MNTADKIQAFLDECELAEYCETGEALDLLRAAKRELRVLMGSHDGWLVKSRQQADLIRELRDREEREYDAIAELQERFDIVHQECVNKEEEISDLQEKLALLTWDMKKPDKSIEEDNRVLLGLENAERRHAKLWADVVAAEQRAEVYKDILIDLVLAMQTGE